MKRAVSILAMLFAPLLAIGCDSTEPSVAKLPATADPPPSVARGSKAVAKKKKQPGARQTPSPTTPKGRF
jgi:hypothetical protein